MIYIHCSTVSIGATCQVSVKTENDQSVPEKIFDGLLPYAWRLSWSCDLDYQIYLHIGSPMKLGFDWPRGFREEGFFFVFFFARYLIMLLSRQTICLTY